MILGNTIFPLTVVLYFPSLDIEPFVFTDVDIQPAWHDDYALTLSQLRKL